MFVSRAYFGLQLFGEACKNQLVRVVYHFMQLFAGKGTAHVNGVPVRFVHVVTGFYFGIAFAQFGGKLRVAFGIKVLAILKAGK